MPRWFDVTAHSAACPGSFCDGAWNVVVEGRKLAGTAQRWRATPAGRVVLIHAAILIGTPDAALWPVLGALQAAAFPDEPSLRADNHIALEGLMAGAMSRTAFPGALIRAAKDRLSALAHRERRAA
ncbi:MAG: hypothetical protein KDJ80_08325 [Nitratireductor sp.]|nr:hypothetical protein [Nitratireductor sp.]